MTHSYLSDDPILLSLSVHESGLSELRIEDVTRCISLEDAVSVLSTALPELMEKMAETVVEGDKVSKNTTIFPKYVVKVSSTKGEVSALLFNQQCRRPYYQKFKSSSEENIPCYVNFIEQMISLLGSPDKVDELFARMNIITKVGEDPCKLTASNYLYPSIVCQIDLIKRTDCYGVDSIRYVMPKNGISRQVLSMPRTWIRYTDQIENIDRNWFNLMPLPNFFDKHDMCFGSISKEDLLDYDGKGPVILDQFLELVYSSYFNTDLYHNATLHWSISNDTKSRDVITDAMLEVIPKINCPTSSLSKGSLTSKLHEAISYLYDESSNLLAHIIQRNYTTMSKGYEDSYYP